MRKLKYLAMLAIVLALSFSLVPAAPTLAAPAVASVTETAFSTDTTNHNVNMPAAVDEGDLLIAVFANDGSATVATPSGWSLLASNAYRSQVRISVYYEIAAGTEAGTLVNFVTSAAEQAAAQVYRITNWHGVTPPEICTAATGTSTRPNALSLDPTEWDTSDTLWLAVAGQDRGDQAGTTAYPAGYTDGIGTVSSPTISSCRTLSARRTLAVASENPGAFTVPVSEEWIAFTIAVRPRPCNLTISSAEGGVISMPGEGVFTYDEGAIVDLVAAADAGYRFIQWAGNVSTVEDVYAAETTIAVDGDYSITANFVAIYDLSINSTGGGSVIEPSEGAFTYDEGTVVDLVAQAQAGYRFVEWAGDVGTIADVHAAQTTITMSGNYSITASFVARYDLAISSTEGGTVTEPGEGTFTHDGGDIVNLVATPDTGCHFVKWAGDVGTIPDVYASEATITMNGDYSIAANFGEEPQPPMYPTVTTKTATDITTSSATLHMSYSVGDYGLIQVRFGYKKLADTEWSYTAWVSKSADGNHIEVLTGLDPSTTYEFIAQLDYDQTIEGAILHFTTGAPPPWGSGGGCFIATAAYGTPTAKEINILREFRDEVLLKTTVGSQFVALYYQFSPPTANVIAENDVLRTLVRELLIDPVVRVIEATGDVWRQ